MNNKYTPVIGLEVHVELKTKSKMFCRCSADYFGKEPNTHVCPICLGLPGALPVPNKKAIEWCIMIGLALGCEIPLFSKFDRKNYFYPDLAKGYQISQYDQPFAINGHVVLNNAKDLDSSPTKPDQNDNPKKIRIRRVHMEEDTGKLIHSTVNGKQVSLIDFNRSGVPLVEIVTDPDFSSAEDVVEYLKKLQQIVRYLDVSNADMEKGDMRLEPNISLRQCHPEERATKDLDSSASPQNDKNNLPSYKVEVKNINSFRFVEKAITYELKRQEELLEKGVIPAQETRGFVEATSSTKSQRTKEEAQDYRYFPEPDIPPFEWEESYVKTLKQNMPELPDQKQERFKKEYSLSSYDSEILTRERELAEYFEEAVSVGKKHGVTPKQIANVIINKKIDTSSTLPATIIEDILTTKKTAQVDKKELENAIAEVLKEFPKAVEDYKKGKENVLMFLLGQVMKKLQGKIDPTPVKEMIKKNLQS